MMKVEEQIDLLADNISLVVLDYTKNYYSQLENKGFDREDLLDFARATAKVKLNHLHNDLNSKVLKMIEERF